MNPWGDAPNWGGRDRQPYQRVLDELALAVYAQREARLQDRFDAWLRQHAPHNGDVILTDEGAWCAGCGEKYGG